jgi:hypothetical protein
LLQTPKARESLEIFAPNLGAALPILAAGPQCHAAGQTSKAKISPTYGTSASEMAEEFGRFAWRDGKLQRQQAVENIAQRYLEWVKVFEGVVM